MAIANSRLVDLADGRVAFRWCDRAHGRRVRVMTLDAKDFIGRFLLHVLPRRFVRIRRYGLLANRVREERLALARRRIAESRGAGVAESKPSADDRGVGSSRDEKADSGLLCPACGEAHMVRVEQIAAVSRRGIDSS